MTWSEIPSLRDPYVSDNITVVSSIVDGQDNTNENSNQTWETDLQKSIEFLLNPLFIFRNDLYVNLLYYMHT